MAPPHHHLVQSAPDGGPGWSSGNPTDRLRPGDGGLSFSVGGDFFGEAGAGRPDASHVSADGEAKIQDQDGQRLFSEEEVLWLHDTLQPQHRPSGDDSSLGPGLQQCFHFENNVNHPTGGEQGWTFYNLPLGVLLVAAFVMGWLLRNSTFSGFFDSPAREYAMPDGNLNEENDNDAMHDQVSEVPSPAPSTEHQVIITIVSSIVALLLTNGIGRGVARFKLL